MAEDLFEVVSIRDPAIDIDATTIEALNKYAHERDLSLLKFAPGRKPQRFFLRQAPVFLWGDFLSFKGTDADARGAFSVCVERVEDMHQKGGTSLEGVTRIVRKNGIESMALEVLQQFSPITIAEIGGVAYQRSLFQNETEVYCPPPPSCLAALERQISRRAASNPSSEQ